MTVTTSYGVGQYATGEAHCLIRPKYGAGQRGAIWCHGANRSAADGVGLADYADIARAAAEDRPVIYSDLGGLYSWGNDTSVARVADAKTFLQANGASTGKVVLLAASMGAAAACNFARVNPTLVQALALFIPAVDVEDIRVNNRQGTQAGIEAAYGTNAGWQTARPTHNPVEYATADLAGKFPIKVWYSDDDPTCILARVQAFIAAVGAESQSLGPQGHAFTGIDLLSVRAWIAAH